MIGTGQVVHRLGGRLRTMLQSRDLAALHRGLAVLQRIGSPAPFEQRDLPLEGRLRIGFIVPGMPRHSGGHTSILRLGTYLQRFGHEVQYLVFDGGDVRALRANAASNLSYYEGQVVPLSEVEGRFDLGVATHWLSVYHLCEHRDRFARKAYFVQDFEPAFSAEGDIHHLSLHTYRMGLRIVSLGAWNAQRIRAATGNSEVEVIDFPVEPKQYAIVERTIEIGSTVRLAVYTKPEGKRGVNLIFQGLALLERELRARGRQAEINVFGVDRSIDLPLGRNIGKLSHEGLLQLYRSCHIGVAASFTNISLVPYEMLMCGLPVVDWQAGSGPTFFAADEMVFSGLFPADFVRCVMGLIDDPVALNAFAQRGQQAVALRTWERTARQFLDAARR